MAQVTGTIPYARGRVFPLTMGANAAVGTVINSFDIPRTSIAYGVFNGKEYMCGVYWVLDTLTETPTDTAPVAGSQTGFFKRAFIATTPKYPNGVLIMYFLPYAGVDGLTDAVGNPRFLYYGPNFTTRGYWACVTSYTSNNAVLKGKYLFERDSSTHKYRFTNAAGAKVTPYRTGALPMNEVNSIVGTFKFLVYYLPLT